MIGLSRNILLTASVTNMLENVPTRKYSAKGRCLELSNLMMAFAAIMNAIEPDCPPITSTKTRALSR
jgi:hypothetical protein